MTATDATMAVTITPRSFADLTISLRAGSSGLSLWEITRASRLAPSLTSREIVTRVALPARAREALSGLVVAVEVSRFGGAEPGEREFQACLDRFEVFLATYRGAA